MTIHTDEFHAPALDNIWGQGLSPEELEMVSGGGFWDDILNVTNQVAPRVPVLASLL